MFCGRMDVFILAVDAALCRAGAEGFACEWTADALQAVAGCALLHEPPACLEVVVCSVCGE